MTFVFCIFFKYRFSYRQAQTAVLLGLPRLQAQGLPTKRPEDYFAQMVKSDEHMKKVSHEACYCCDAALFAAQPNC